MKILEHTAKSIGDQFYQKISGQLVRGRVHSIFKNVINILCDGELYTIGKSKIGNGPLTILVQNISDNFDQLTCKGGDRVIIAEEVVHLNGIRINLKEANIWSSQWQNPPHLEHMFNLLPQLKELVIREGDLRGLGLLLLNEEEEKREGIVQSYTQQVLIEQAVPLIERLQKSVLLYPKRFWSVLLDFVGLGPGLTPAGDDFIMGFILTLRYLEWGKVLQLPKLDFKVVREKVQRDTNLISATGVLLALEGKPLELIGDVLENLFSGSKVKTILSVLRLIDRGSTSGTDILTGIIVASELFQKTQCIHWRIYT